MPRLLTSSRPEDLPPKLSDLRTPCYLHHTPKRLQWPVLTLALLVALGGLGFIGWRVSLGNAGATEWLLVAFLLLFFVILVRPKSWRPHIALAADDRGLYFLGTSPTEPVVFVAWSEVGPMTVERRPASGGGPSRTVVVRIDDGSEFWMRAKQSGLLLHIVNAPDAEGRRGVPLGNAGQNPDETLEALTVLRNRGESGPR